MKCNDIQHKFTGFLDKSLTEVANSEIKKHLKSCTNCNQELEELKSFLAVLDSQEMETPSANLRSNFNKMLAQEIETVTPKVIQLKLQQDWKSYLKIAASIVIIIGAFLFGKHQSNIPQIVSIKNENQEEVLALLENSSASKRILGVSDAEEFTKKDTKIIEALINRLFFDKNANVRLAAAETLSKFSSEIIVRDALIKSLETDENSTVQIELIRILAKIQEKRAIESMQKLLKNEETPQFVKQQVELNLPNLL
ncbi:HEAT repeat domain-containing protein [Polaribacter cellanae]|uniref:HEAT repeat domain-containing protein n=1 Tax=Polaribacter cellanae TaxID=2818493 RepID=A0A975H6H9_9FLAO|nr:HEAT repeat domain-containing protein [Polaribacter cellanae]QTE22018.1 HEAT repeat domain-containing protein [Polaribacter cellanae]